MGLAATGVLMILLPLTIRIVAVRSSTRNPTATPTPWTWALRTPMLWAGVVLVILAINHTVGAVALAIGMVVLLSLAAKMVINAPGATRRAWRTIGDPDAWRGTPAVNEVAETAGFGQLLWHKIALGTLGVLLLVLIATFAGQH